jgi:hypothetical protein
MRKNCVKLLLGLSVAVMLFGTPALASESQTVDNGVVLIEGEEPTRPEQFMWFYRTYEGRRQKRLWSITYGYWVTDWIDIDPV